MNPILDERALDYADKALKEKQWSPISEKNKILMALATGAAPVAVNTALGLRMGAGIIPKSLIMGALGYAIPSIINEALTKNDDERRGFLQSEFNRASNLPLSKEAGLPAVGSIVGKVGKYSLEGGKDFVRGVVSPIKGKTVGATALSIGSKAILGYGMYQGGKYIGQKYKKPGYVKYLRNNILAGNIKPEELSGADLEAVKNMGMK